MMNKSHYFFLLNFSPWPFLVSISCFNLFYSFLSFVKFMMFESFIFSILNIFLILFLWWPSYSGEFNLEGCESKNLESGIKVGMVLFISSEIFFFFSFFWSYFHFFLSPSSEISVTWPPFSIEMFNHLDIPLINTLILLSSGVSITISHYYLMNGSKMICKFYLFFTFFLGLIFTFLQLMEYKSSFFSISDSTFGTSFFMLTGFHGIHVIIGSVFLMTVFFRFYNLISSKASSLSFEMSSWYWHFVDLVWIFLYFIIYYLNN